LSIGDLLETKRLLQGLEKYHPHLTDEALLKSSDRSSGSSYKKGLHLALSQNRANSRSAR
jgi:hypothetical protein